MPASSPRTVIDSDAAFAVSAPRSTLPVAIAALVIGLAAVAGLYRGVDSVRPVAPGLKVSPTTDAIVGAAPAVALPHNPDWSTLSGPQVLPPPTVKPKPQEDDADSADSEAEASQAAQAIEPGTDAPVPVTPPVAPAAAAPTPVATPNPPR